MSYMNARAREIKGAWRADREGEGARAHACTNTSCPPKQPHTAILLLAKNRNTSCPQFSQGRQGQGVRVQIDSTPAPKRVHAQNICLCAFVCARVRACVQVAR